MLTDKSHYKATASYVLAVVLGGFDTHREVEELEAYEFYATPENGAIMIPEQYREAITSGVKVILLEQKPRNKSDCEAISVRKSEMLLAPTLKTNGWKFDREEANAR